MDTPDRAADFANEELADAIHRDWLVLSTQSGPLSCSDGRSKAESYWLTNSWSTRDAATFISPHSGNIYGSRKERGINESSWLLGGYTGSSKNRTGNIRSAYLKVQNKPYHQQRPINNCLLYDNISFADSFINQPASLNGDATSKSNYHSELLDSSESKNEERSGESVPKFRLFVAFYLLLGITLAIYSRNALSLAAVGMLASNAINTELEDFLDRNSFNLIQTRGDPFEQPVDGSCPIHHEKFSSKLIQNVTNLMNTSSNYLSTKKQLEEAFKESVKRQVKEGKLIDWSPSEQGLVFASGSLGNLLIAIPLTRMGEIYGPKWIIFMALSGATLQAALMPTIAPCRFWLVIIFQVIFNGLTYGADCVAYTLFAHWLPPTEMAFFVSSLLICYQLGTITSSFVTAQILTQGRPWSWCFYTPALLCGSWTLLWALFGASEPAQSLFISKVELDFLKKQSKISLAANEADKISETTKPISWLKIFKDKNIWAIISVKFSIRWYFSVYASLMPTYLSSVAHMPVKTIGQVSIFQSVICLISGILMSFFTRTVVLKRPFNLSLAAFRKIFQSIVNFGLALNLLLFITFDCNSAVTIIALTLSGVCINFYVAAGLQLPLDLSSSHCGLITSISNTLALGQVLGAPISGLILNEGPRERSQWRIVWLLAITLNTISGLLFICLVDSKPKNYNKLSLEEMESNGESEKQDDSKRRRRILRQEQQKLVR